MNVSGCQGDDMNINWILIIQTLYTMCATIAMVGGIILLTHSRVNRARRFHACSMIFCCVIYFIRYLEMLLGDGESHMVDMLNPWMQIFGIFLVMLLSLYPLEVVRPGWLNWKRTFRLSIPYLSVVAFCLIGICIFGDGGFRRLSGWSDCLEHLASFDVMSRLLLFVCFIYYFCSIICFIFRSDWLYAHWLETDHPGGDEVVRNESWLKYYGYGMILILFGYLSLVLFGFHPWVLIYHNTVLQIFLFYTFYKVSFFDSPFLEEFYAGEETVSLATADDNSGTAVVNDPGIVDKWKLYKLEIERWFETERPYLNEDFRLNDVVDRFPLNRSYISRIFNEGYGKSFSIVVRDYRLREGERLLNEEPTMTVAQVAERCGFSSSSSFIRAFSTMHNGITPKQYREQLIAKS